MPSKRTRIKPALNAQCLCGSGFKFKRCCYGDDDAPCMKYTRLGKEDLDSGNLKSALAHMRKAITNYTILHKTNTAPFMPTDNEGINWLLGIDIDALSELVENLLLCYRLIGDYHSFEIDLERLRTNIADARWQRKITYFQILASLGDHWPEEVGKKKVNLFNPIEEETDPKIIQLYLHFRSEDMSFKKNIDLIEKLIQLADTSGEKLQYKVLKAVKYYYVGDEKEAGELIQEAIAEFESSESPVDSGYARIQYALALGLLGDIKKSVKYKIQSIGQLEKLFVLDLWTEEGKAGILFEIGKALHSIKRFEDAISYFNHSLSIVESNITKVFLCQTLLEFNDPLSIDIIEDVERHCDKLSKAERLDFAFIYSAVGISFKRREMVGRALDHLSDFDVVEPVFEKYRVKLITDISIMFKENSFDSEISLLSVVKKAMKATTRYFILQPNVAGLGININNVIDDISQKSNK